MWVYVCPGGLSPLETDSSGQQNTLCGFALSFLLSETILKPLARSALLKFLFQTDESPLACPFPLTSAQAWRERPSTISIQDNICLIQECCWFFSRLLLKPIRVNYLKDEDIGIGGVLPQCVFPRDRELCFLRVCPLHTRILAAVDLHPQPGYEEWFGVRHSCARKKVPNP